jgi:NitT/TauT family transport system substrate-binding protein
VGADREGCQGGVAQEVIFTPGLALSATVSKRAGRAGPRNREDLMPHRVTRRRLIQTSGAAALGAGLASPSIVRAQDLLEIKTGTLFGGWAHIGNDTLLDLGLDKKHGFRIPPPQTYNVLATYYADFAKGSFDFGVGTWDFFARAYMQGAPLRILGLISEGTQAGFLGRGDGPSNLKEMKGKTLAAMQASGTYQMARIFAKTFDGLEFEKDVNVQNAPNPPGTIALVAGNRADAALTWEQSLSLGLDMVKGSRVFTNLGEYYKQHTGRSMPYFAVAMHKNAIDRMPKGSTDKLVALFDELAKWMHANVDAYATRASRINVEPRVIKTAINSGRLRFVMRATSNADNRKDVLSAADLLAKGGMFPKPLDDGIFAA